MGGHEGGEVASTRAVQTVNSTFYSTSDDIQKALLDAFQLANRKILEQARREKNLAGMGTTCTAVAVKEGLAYCAHVGDSRAYLVRKGQAYRMTEDHSVTMELVNRGLLTLAEANHHEDRNVILRAMGTQPKLEVSTWKEPFPLIAGDSMVLCSDGLYEVVGDDEIGRLCDSSPTPGAACRALIDAALERQCTDNVTAAVIRVMAAVSEGARQ
jgi:protein phosphatase